MKNKTFKTIVTLLSVVLILCVTTISASAAVVTDGKDFYELGDTNKDKTVNIIDLVRTKKYLVLDSEVEILYAAADVNGDGSVTALDLTGLRKYLLNDNYSFSVDDSLWGDKIK